MISTMSRVQLPREFFIVFPVIYVPAGFNTTLWSVSIRGLNKDHWGFCGSSFIFYLRLEIRFFTLKYISAENQHSRFRKSPGSDFVPTADYWIPEYTGWVRRNRTPKYLPYLSLHWKTSPDRVSLFEEMYTAIGKIFVQSHVFRQLHGHRCCFFFFF